MKLDVANLLSLSRVGMALLVWLRPESPTYVLVMLALAAVSDGLDGAVGRRTHAHLQGSANVGAWLDPVCDKIFAVSAALAVATHYPIGPTGPLVIALLLFRDVTIPLLAGLFRLVSGRARFHAHDFRARASGKATTVAQFATLIAVLLWPQAVLPLALVTGALGALSVMERVVLAVRT